ncbi:MAG TPA: hypothetical protein VK338_06415 [Candidatus Nitrosocosmicus sp.]|nr:hypothetical protein [Candidatus Nitrosocosmicus sp.]
MKIKINYSLYFTKSFKKLPVHVVKKFYLKEDLFKSNPFHPSLKTHKLTNDLKEFWAFSISYHYRVMLKMIMM